MISFGSLNNLWLVGPVLFGLSLSFLLTKFRYKIFSILCLGNYSFGHSFLVRQKFKLFLWLLALLAIFIATLAPQWGEQSLLVPQTGRNIVIALDVSKSMLAQDLKPSRLAFAKSKITNLLQKLAGEQVGLILFAADAISLCPLTRDQDLVLGFLEEVDQHTVSSGGTNIAKAIMTATKMFESHEHETNLLLIFSDGEDFSPDLTAAGQSAQAAGIKVFTFGVATSHGAPIPQYDLTGAALGFVKNQADEIVISRLNQAVLQQIAQKCAGHSLLVSAADDHDLEQLINWVASFERNRFAEQNFLLKLDRYYYFALIALIALAIEWFL